MSRSSYSTTDSALIFPQLPLQRGWKPSQRMIEEVPPQALLEEEHDPEISEVVRGTMPPSTSHEMACSVCQRHCARYQCPQCHVPYCSVECYRNHSSKGINSGTTTMSACTEVFYKKRVSSILELEAKEQKDNTQRMLNQYYHDTQLTGNIDDNHDVSEDQLYEFLEFLETNGDANLTHQELLARMPFQLRSEFLRDLQDGKLQETILKPWHPWWRKKLGPIDEDSSIPSPLFDDLTTTKTLDERLLRVPRFSTICKKPQSSQLLLYNIINIVYSFCWTMRLYHGPDNIMLRSITKVQNETNDAVLVVEAGITLFQNSTVLRKDARYTSLEQVLPSCTSSSTKVFPDGCNTPWFILVEDCAHILASHRLVGRALLESCDLLKNAIQHLKQDDSPYYDDNSNNHNKEVIVRLRQVRKKVEYFLSWSQYAKEEFGESIKNDLMDWARQWTSNEFKSVTGDGPIPSWMELEVPDQTNLQQPSKQKPTAPLIVEIATNFHK